MEGFKTLPKMKSFKTGGAVGKCSGGRMKTGGKVAHDDVVEDKKIVKKAFKMHDDQSHEGEKTDLSKLKKGGRSKKEVGTVKKFSKADAPSKAVSAPPPNIAPEGPSADADPTMGALPFKKGGKAKKAKKLKKFAEGGYTDADFDIGRGALDAIGKVPGIGGALKSGATSLRDAALGTPAQNRLAQEKMDRIAAKKAADAARKAALLEGNKGPGALTAGAMAAPAAAPSAPAAPAPAAPAAPVPGAMKRGGKAKSCK